MKAIINIWFIRSSESFSQGVISVDLLLSILVSIQDFNGEMIFTTTCLLVLVVGSLADMPLPFTRELEYSTPHLQGNDVTIYQNLIVRDDAVTSFASTGAFDKATGDRLCFVFV